MTIKKNLLVELFVEELPPKALKKLGEAFAGVLRDQLVAQGLADAGSVLTAYASPRRLAAHLTDVAAQAADKAVSQKLMPVSVGLDAAGQPTPALLKRLAAAGRRRLGRGRACKRARWTARPKPCSSKAPLAGAHPGRRPAEGAGRGHRQAADPQGDELPARKRLRAARLDQRQLRAPGARPGRAARRARSCRSRRWACRPAARPTATASRPRSTRWCCAMPTATRCSWPTKAPSSPASRHAASRSPASSPRRRSKVGAGSAPIDDDALLDEVTALVERPNVLVCEFEREFLDVPQECLILTMKANQKYFPLLDAPRQAHPQVPGGQQHPSRRRQRGRSAATSAWCARAWPMPSSSSTRTARSRWPRASSSWPRWSITTSWAPRASA